MLIPIYLLRLTHSQESPDDSPGVLEQSLAIAAGLTFFVAKFERSHGFFRAPNLLQKGLTLERLSHFKSLDH
jgi:hypothetical protein